MCPTASTRPRTIPSRPALRPFQDEGVRFLRKQGRAFLADEMGLGKSAQLITAADGGDTLVVAPAMVLDGGTWDDEIARWADHPDRFRQVAYSSLTYFTGEIKKVNNKPVRVYKVRPEYDRHWDTVIFDEAHYAKGRGSIRTDASQQLAYDADQTFLATGTPIPNYAHELFTLLQMLRPKDAQPGGPLGSYWRWAQQWFSVFRNQYSNYNIGLMLGCNSTCLTRPATDPCEHYYRFAEANLGDQFLLRKRDDVLPDLPPLTEVTVKIKMGTAQAKAYRSMKKDMVAETEDGDLVVSWSSSAKHVRLDRISTGLSLLDESVPLPDRFGVNDGKLIRLAEDLESRSRPTLVMAHYQRTVEACHRVALNLGLKSAVVYGPTSKAERLRNVRAFQSGELDVLVGSLETLAEGLTLVAADLVIFVEKSFRPSRNDQALRRIHRLGQTRPVTALDYVTSGTIDEKKRELLRTKTDHQVRTLTAADMVRLA